MKFDVLVGNPPYQGIAKRQIYASYYTEALEIANNICMLFPTGWQAAKKANGLSRMNNKEIKRDSQIVNIHNMQNVFAGVSGVEWTNIILWRKDHDNGLDGKQNIVIGDETHIRLLPIKRTDVAKPEYIQSLQKQVQEYGNFTSVSTLISPRQPYGLRTDILKDSAKYGLPPLNDVRHADDDIRVFTPKGLKYTPQDYPFPRLGTSFDSYKVFIPAAWGGWSGSTDLGGPYANTFIGYPADACIESYLECGPFATKQEAVYTAKYLMTNFTRALLYLNKYSQHTPRGTYAAIPQQDFTEDWWGLSVAEIDEKLFEKYNVPDEIKEKVYANIQIKSDENVIDYGPQKKEME